MFEPRSPVALVLLLLVLVCCLSDGQAVAATYHVSPFGSNTPPYDTYGKAAHHPREAISAATGYGDTVLIHAGRYDIDTTIDVALGVILLGDDADSVVLRWYPGLRTFNWALKVAGDNEISGLGFLADQIGFASSNPIAIFMTVSTGVLRVHHCRLVGMGIYSCSGGERDVYQNYFHLQSSHGCVACGLGPFEIHNNTFFGGVGHEGGGASGVRAIESPTTIHDNIFDFSRTETRGVPIETDKSFKPVEVCNNLIIGGDAPIEWIYTDGAIENNTIVGPHNPYPTGHALFYQSERDTLVIRNNVFFKMTHLPVFGNRCPDCPNTGRITYTHNAFWPPVDSFYQLDPHAIGKVWLVTANNFNAYPMFVGDSTYRLQWGSPLIDAGDPGVLDTDGSRSDIGWTGGPGGMSYEYPNLPPLPPESLSATGRDTLLTVRWRPRPEADVAGYRLFRGYRSGFWLPGLPPTYEFARGATDTLLHLSRRPDSLYYVVTAFDSSGQESEPSAEAEYIISAHPLGHAPQWTPVAAVRVKAKDSLTLLVQATDPDGDPLTLKAIDLPANAGFTDHGDGTGRFGFRPTESQIGDQSVLLVASDGFLQDTLVLVITVLPANRAPVWVAIAPQVVRECETVRVCVIAFDADGDLLELRSAPLPPHASFTDSGNGVGALVFTPDTSQAGEYRIEVYAWDGAVVATLAVTVEVVDWTCIVAGRRGILRVYPNPLNDRGLVEVGVPGDAGIVRAVKVVLHDLVGRTVATCYQGNLAVGVHTLEFDVGDASLGHDLASGVYFLRLQIGSETVGEIVKVAVIK